MRLVDDLEEALTDYRPDVLSRCVVVEASPEWPGQLVFQPFVGEQDFLARYSDWISRHLTLNELYNLTAFIELLEADSHTVFCAPSAQPILDDYARLSEPLAIEGYSLRPFQTFGLNQALERALSGKTTGDRMFFWNWSAGAGKSFVSGAGAKVLFDRDVIDLVVACTLSKLKVNLSRDYCQTAGLQSMVNDHVRPATRREHYLDPTVQAFVMNYEKLWVDEDALREVTAGKRVLFVLDECHRLISDGAHNKARKALDRLTKDCHAIVWPMSATVVDGNPLRFRDVFSLDGRPAKNPLGTKKDFTARYAHEVREIPVKTRSGGRYTFTAYDWNLPALQDIRHRVADRTMTARKTDPGIREQFKGIECIPVMVQPTAQQQKLFDVITDLAKEAQQREEALTQHYLALRIAAINPGALWFGTGQLVIDISERVPDLLDAKHSAKIEVLNGMLESIREAQDKAVLFCHWTNLGLLPLVKHIEVPHVLHYGTGQTTSESQAAQDRFKSDPDITLFASSDAGTYGLNLQCARYVISADPTYSYDALAQRNARIDRVDSHLDGLTAYILIVEGSVEERVWQVCNERRVLAAAVQGTQEELTYGDGEMSRSEMNDLSWLVFGDKER